MKSVKPLRQLSDGTYFYGIEDETEYVWIPPEQIEEFLNMLANVQTHSDSEAICSFYFDEYDNYQEHTHIIPKQEAA